MITKFKNFKLDIISDKEYKDWLEILDQHYDDLPTSELELSWYLRKVQQLQKEGGTIYRLVFLNDKKDLNVTQLGHHWTIKNEFNHLYNELYDELEDKGKSPYIIIAEIEPDSIHVDYSLEYFTELPEEYEVTLKKQPVAFKLKSF